jgi:diphosphomevalonate decarboxylase
LEPKAVGSTEAMERTRLSSPYYDKWIESCQQDLKEAIAAVESRDFTSLGEITERSALGMHAAAFAARPGIVFWKGATLEVLHLVRNLRASGREIYFTCDAGPQPKVLCLPSDEEEVVATINKVPGVVSTIRCSMGHGASLFESK